VGGNFKGLFIYKLYKNSFISVAGQFEQSAGEGGAPGC
jgi:hypothetical protein